jgi:hypothetical protein
MKSNSHVSCYCIKNNLAYTQSQLTKINKKLYSLNQTWADSQVKLSNSLFTQISSTHFYDNTKHFTHKLKVFYNKVILVIIDGVWQRGIERICFGLYFAILNKDSSLISKLSYIKYYLVQ